MSGASRTRQRDGRDKGCAVEGLADFSYEKSHAPSSAAKDPA